MTIFNVSAAVALSSTLLLLPRNVDSFCGIHNFNHRRFPDGMTGACTPTVLYLSSTTADYYYYDGTGGGRGVGRKDFYNILGLDSFATAKDIKNAFRKLAKKYHPDLNKSRDSTEMFQEVNKAYEVLKDPKMRLNYDMQFFGHDSFRAASASSSSASYSNTQQNEYVVEIDDFEGYYDPICARTATTSTSRSSSNKNRGHDDYDYATWVKSWEPQSQTKNEQIPCDQPNRGPTSWGGSIPFDECVKSRMDSERYRRQQRAAAEDTAANAAHIHIPLEDVIRAKMGDRDISVDEGPYSNSRSIPYDEFVREKMNFDNFVSGEKNRKRQPNSHDENKSCDEYVDPYMGSTSVYKTHIECDQGHGYAPPCSPEQRTDFDVSAHGFVDEQVVEYQQRSARQSESPSYSNQSFFSTRDSGGNSVQQPQSQPPNLVMEASDLWQPMSRSLCP